MTSSANGIRRPASRLTFVIDVSQLGTGHLTQIVCRLGQSPEPGTSDGGTPEMGRRWGFAPANSGPARDYAITLEDLQSTDPESFLENIRLLARAAHEQHDKISSDTPFLLFEDIFSLFPLR